MWKLLVLLLLQQQIINELKINNNRIIVKLAPQILKTNKNKKF